MCEEIYKVPYISVNKYINSFIHLFFIPWIRTGLQNPFGYGNSQICLDNLKVGQYNSAQTLVARSVTIYEVINIVYIILV
jgi:hypothetical protein